jgi:thiol-disulfide isomerase/thioredoxin
LKKNIYLFILIFFSFSAYSQGVNWLKDGNLRDIFNQAKASNKSVFIEVFSPDCHVCKAFKPTFSEKIVGDFYNKNYVSYQLDVDSEESKAFLNVQKIWLPSIPTLLFFDKNVKLQHIAVMSENRNSAQILVDAAKTAQNGSARTSNYRNRFNAGDRNPNFLIEHALMARYQKDTLINFDAVQAYFKTQKPAELTNATNLLVLEKAVMDIDADLFQNLINNLPKYYAVKEKAKINGIAENITMFSLYSRKGQLYNVAKIAKVKEYLTKIGIDKKSIDGRVWMAEASAYFRENNPKAAIAIVENRVKGMVVSKGEAKYLCQFVKSKTIDKYAISIAEKWCKIGN